MRSCCRRQVASGEQLKAPVCFCVNAAAPETQCWLSAFFASVAYMFPLPQPVKRAVQRKAQQQEVLLMGRFGVFRGSNPHLFPSQSYTPPWPVLRKHKSPHISSLTELSVSKRMTKLVLQVTLASPTTWALLSNGF